MTMGRPVADLDDFLDQAPPRLQSAPARSSTPTVKASRAPLIVAAVALLFAVGGVGFWLTTRDTPAVANPNVGVATAELSRPAPDGVAGFAELFVIAYLSGDQHDLATFLPAAPPLDAMTPGAHVVRHASVIEIADVSDQYWAVTLAADVLDLEPAGYISSGLSYFRVGVVDDGGRLVATALPSRVAAPPSRTAPPRSIEPAGAEPAVEVAALVGDFLEALLTGERDIGMYTAATSPIVDIRPAPYAAIAVTGIGRFSNGSILATVDARAPNGAIHTLQYVLRTVDEGGGVVVAELMAGPPQIDGQQQ